MTTLFEDSPKFSGISGDYARVTGIEDRVLIRAIDSMAEEYVIIAMTPDQARALAAGIVAAAKNAEAVLRALLDHEITGDEIAMIISEIALRFCGNSLKALVIMGMAVSFTTADGADHDGRMIQ